MLVQRYLLNHLAIALPVRKLILRVTLQRNLSQFFARIAHFFEVGMDGRPRFIDTVLFEHIVHLLKSDRAIFSEQTFEYLLSLFKLFLLFF